VKKTNTGTRERLQLSNPQKVFWPEEGDTKLDLARFYAETFAKWKPYVANRLLWLERCPDGMKGECFYQKEKPLCLRLQQGSSGGRRAGLGA